MENCNHTNASKTTISRELSGHIFTGEALVCRDCNAEMWDDALHEKFNSWVSNLHVKPRVQFKMSGYSDQCLEQVLNRFPGANKAIFVRAMITVYMLLLQQGPKANDILNQIFDSEYFQTFESDSKSDMFQTDVKPNLYFKIQSWAKIFDLKPNEFASEAFHIMMAFCIAEDKELKDFWNSQILPQIENIIIAA